MACGFCKAFCNTSFSQLTNPKGGKYAAFMKFLYNITKLPFLSELCARECDLPAHVRQDRERRLNLIITKLLQILWANGNELSSIGNKAKNGNVKDHLPLPMRVSSMNYDLL